MENMDRVCHLCFDGEGQNLVLLNDQELMAKIDRVFYFEVTQFSQSCAMICVACRQTIEEFYWYAEKVAQNQAQLRDRIRTELARAQDHTAVDGITSFPDDAGSLEEVECLDEAWQEDHLKALNESTDANKAPSVSSDSDDDESNQNWMPDDDEEEEVEELQESESPFPVHSKRLRLSNRTTLRVSKEQEATQQTDHERSGNELSPQLSAERLVLQHHNLSCDLCSAPLSDFSHLHKHYKIEHSTKGYLRCCNRMIYKKCWMIEHLQVHLNPDTFRCELCAKSYSSSKVLKEHTKEVHAPAAERSLPCTKCSKAFVSRSHLNAHIMVAHGTVPCPQCQKVLASQGSLRKHMVAVHGEGEQHVCEVCARVFRSKQCFDAHRKEHEGRQHEGKVQCDQCDVWLTNKYCLRKHVRRMHSQQEAGEVACETCGKMAPNREALYNHVRRSHTATRFECSWCDKKFKRSHHMREHIAIHHTGEELYGCPHCSERFNTKNKQYLHRRTVHTE
uniref:C2H2-type domain-containing protein n=2 Tax=Anopheles stephensi TaxID=30069 RepID=A0A182YD30_ANOST